MVVYSTAFFSSIERSEMGMCDVYMFMSLLGFGVGMMFASFHTLCWMMLLLQYCRLIFNFRLRRKINHSSLTLNPYNESLNSSQHLNMAISRLIEHCQTIPIFKNGDKIDNHKLLPNFCTVIFSKVFEKTMIMLYFS